MRHETIRHEEDWRMSQATPLSDRRKIPTGWANVHLHGLVESLESGISVGGEERALSEGENAILMVSAVTSGKFRATEAKAVGLAGTARLNKHVRADSVLVNRANGSADLVGSAVYVCSGYRNLFLSDKLWQLRPKADRASAKFLSFLLSSPDFRRQVLMRSSGGTGMLNISSGSYLSIPVLAPPLSEQEAMADILNLWAIGAERLVQLFDAKRERKRGLMQQLLTGRKRFKEFKSERWQVFKLGELFSERVEMGRGDLPLVSITGQNGVVPRDSLTKRDTSSEDKSKYLRIAPGDIGYNTMRMWQGVAGLSKLEGIVSPAYTICIPSKRIDGQLAAYLFKHTPVVHLFRRHSQGLVDDTLALKFPNFAQIHVTIPDVPEQRRIAAVLSACDREIELLQKQLEALKEQKRGLMQKLLTGEVRVKVGDTAECGMRSADLPRTGATSGKD
jgi:type I restriction enzyme S subunit